MYISRYMNIFVFLFWTITINIVIPTSHLRVLYHFDQVFTGCDAGCPWTLPDTVFECDRYPNCSFQGQIWVKSPSWLRGCAKLTWSSVHDSQWPVTCDWTLGQNGTVAVGMGNSNLVCRPFLEVAVQNVAETVTQAWIHPCRVISRMKLLIKNQRWTNYSPIPLVYILPPELSTKVYYRVINGALVLIAKWHQQFRNLPLTLHENTI